MSRTLIHCLLLSLVTSSCARLRSKDSPGQDLGQTSSLDQLATSEPCSIADIAKKYKWDVAIDPPRSSCPGVRMFVTFLLKHSMRVPESIFVDVRDQNLSGADGGYVIRLASNITAGDASVTPTPMLNAAGNIHELAHIYYQQELQRNHSRHPYLNYLNRKQKFARLHRKIETLQGSASPALYTEFSASAEAIQPFKWMMDVVELPFEELFADYVAARIMNDANIFAALDPDRSFSKPLKPPTSDAPTEYQYFSAIRATIWAKSRSSEPQRDIKALLNTTAAMTQELMMLNEAEATKKLQTKRSDLNADLLARLNHTLDLTPPAR
jgi:hypothetical protein